MKDGIENSWVSHPGFEPPLSAQQGSVLPLDHSAALSLHFTDWQFCVDSNNQLTFNKINAWDGSPGWMVEFWFPYIFSVSNRQEDPHFWRWAHKGAGSRGSGSPRAHAWAWVIGNPIQNHEICYSKCWIALEKSIFDGFYQNLAYMCQKLFSTDGTTF